MELKEISPEMITDSTFKLIGKDWMLVTAGRKESFNTMTAAWGGLGVLWDKNICFCVIRPTRYTFGFMEKSESFTLSFFEERYGKVLEYCVTKSGRDVNKVTQTNLTPVFENGAVYFSEARLVMVCRKIYTQDIDSEKFLSPEIDTFYPGKDYHRMYVGEIYKCLKG